MPEVKKDFLDAFRAPPHFMLGVAGLDQLPDLLMPEVCFAGRSNAGKSSLINALFGRSDVARVSNTPGRTQQLNYFAVNGQFRLVDMPGYGYAKASKTDKAQWDQLVFDYLCGRANLRRVFVLMDSRHPLQKADKEMLGVLDKAAVPYQIVLTKIDLLRGKNPVEQALAETNKGLQGYVAVLPEILAVSSTDATGLIAMQRAMLQVVA